MSKMETIIDMSTDQRIKKTLSVDFDGVLHSYRTGWHGSCVVTDEPVPGAMEFLRDAAREFDVHIFSARSDTAAGRAAMWTWIVMHYQKHFGIAFGEAMEELSSLRFPSCKPHAHVSLDDRAIQFCGTWPSISEI